MVSCEELQTNNGIAFFGASITQQRNGYASFFSMLESEYKTNVFGYGSMHISDAGICYLPEVLKHVPEYCFLDWLSTAKITEQNFESIKDSIDYILHYLYKINTKPIWLIFPDLMNDKTKIYEKITEYLKSSGQYIIDISKENKDWSIYLRDGLHTNEKGAEFYGETIYERFQLIKKQEYIKPLINFENRIGNIKKISLDYKEFYEEINFIGDGYIIGVSQILGRFSGLLNVNGEHFINWDRWCNFNRLTMKIDFPVNGSSTIKVLNDEFDTTTCKQKCNWLYPKKLIIKDIFYTGEIEITESC